MSYELSTRLQTCLDAVAPLKTIADIGTDHAYLPCVGILENKLSYAIAADIGVGPLESAKATIKRYELNTKIETRLGGGFSILKPNEVEAVVVAGMGGKLIVSILEENIALTRSFERLILQPNIDANLVRIWLAEHQFKIINEKIVLDEGKFYEIIVAEPTNQEQNYTILDLEFGPVLRRETDNDVFKAKWSKELAKNQEILNQLPEGHPRIEAIMVRQILLNEVLSCQ